MSEAPDKESKTEAPTEQKLKKALEEGQAPPIKPLTLVISFVSVALYLFFFQSEFIASLERALAGFLLLIPTKRLATTADVYALLSGTASGMMAFLLSLMLTLYVFNFSPMFLSNSMTLSWKRIAPNFANIALFTKLMKLFSAESLSQLGISILKMSLYLTVAILFLYAHKDDCLDFVLSFEQSFTGKLLALSWTLITYLGLLAVLFGIVEYLFALKSWWQNMHMTKQEVKQEVKDAEGNILLKIRRRSLALQRIRKRMMEAVPTATVVIVNPTHYAVALAYDRGERPAPQVVAKGKNLIALRIREIAEKHGIPVIEDQPLARALYKLTEVDDYIPPEFYRAVAAIINFLDKKIQARGNPYRARQ